MPKNTTLFLCLLLLITSLNTQATLIKVSSGEILGDLTETSELVLEVVDDKLIGGYNLNTGAFNFLYDFVFVDTDFYGAYVDESNLFTLSELTWLNRALQTEVFLDFSWLHLNSNPQLTLGCSSTVQCNIWTAYTPSLSPSIARAHSFSNSYNDAADRFNIEFLIKSDNYLYADKDVYAVWSPSSDRRSVAVNEPKMSIIFLCFLFVLISKCKMRAE